MIRHHKLASIVTLAILLAADAAHGQKLGTDIAGLNLCLYGDCEARGSYAADPSSSSRSAGAVNSIPRTGGNPERHGAGTA
jgi:hypothetical protein